MPDPRAPDALEFDEVPDDVRAFRAALAAEESPFETDDETPSNSALMADRRRTR